MATVPGVPDPQSAGQLTHRQQFVDFKVVVYRLEIPRAYQFVSGSKAQLFNLNDLLSRDFSDISYQDASGDLNKLTDGDHSVFLDFMDQFAQKLQALIAPDGKPLSTDELAEKKIFRELDITPIVRNVSTQMVLEGCNSCVITAIDPFLSAFDSNNKSNYTFNSALPSPAKEGVLNQNDLDTFTFREFDLIRVFASSSIDQKPTDRMRVMQKNADNLKLPAETVRRFVMRPIFTGFVSQITSANQEGQVASIQVQCTGVQRMFMQSVTVFSDAMSNVIANASPEMTMLRDQFSALSNNFNNMSVDDIIRKIFSDYLKPKWLYAGPDTSSTKSKAEDITAPAPDPDVSLGMPSLANLLNALYYVDKVEKKVVASVIPMLPAVLLLHMLKTKYREPIITFDDRLLSPLKFAPDSSNSPRVETVASRDAGSLPNILKPYLDMARDSYATFNATYSAPSEIFDTIRGTTFMEIFEDKTGQFHFRFPRYNQQTIAHDIPVSENISVSVSKDDSSVYTANVASAAIQYSSAGDLIDPKVFIDKLSVMRYGFRRPQMLENPNSVSPDFAAALAKFMRDYKAGRESRTARLEIVGRPDLDVGNMVIFRQGRIMRQGEHITENRELPASNIAVKTMVGYVMSISDRIEVSGRYTQSVELGFVRDASSWTLGGDFLVMHGTIWDVFDRTAVRIVGTPLTSLEGDIPSSSVSKPAVPSDSDPLTVSAPRLLQDDLFMRRIQIPSQLVKTANFRHIASAIELAEKANDPKVQADLAIYGDVVTRRKGADGKMQASDILNNMRATAARINDRLVHLAIWQRTASILKEYSNNTGAFSRQVSQDGFIRFRRTTLQQLASGSESYLAAINQRSLRSGSETVKVTVKGQKRTYVVPLTKDQIRAALISFDSVLQMISSFNTAGHESFVDAWTLIFKSPISTAGDTLSKEQYNRAAAVVKDLDSGVNDLAKGIQNDVNSDTQISSMYTGWDSWNSLLKEAKSQGAKIQIDPQKLNPTPLAGLGITDITE